MTYANVQGQATAEAFWRRVLTAGGFTPLPRWTFEPVAGVGKREVRIPREIASALRRLANELAMPLGSVLLTAHAKVLGALSGERQISTGYATAKGRPLLPCPLTIGSGSWRELLLATRHAELELLEHRDFPVDALAGELGVTRPSFEAVFDLTAQGAGRPGETTVLWVGAQDGDGLVVRLQYRRDALDEACAARIAGYYVTALARIAGDPDAEHERKSLLSAEELHFQLRDLAGPRMKLPERRLHEVFEERARAHPDAVAAIHGARRWTYLQLNRRANRLARALLARDLRREDVVAVVSERNLDWLAAVLAIFKAGGTYLPIEPQFPAERIARTLARADCRLVLTERGSTATLDSALESLTGVEKLFVGAAYEEGRSDGDVGVGVAPDQLAYVFFTSGSTGEPKGAMCEHAGMLNHVLAKIHDLDVREGLVVAQTAPQCFDISLWQLLSALLVGGRTLIVGQEAILDAERFVDTIALGRVAVLQVVPSYLDVVLQYLEQHPGRELRDLRCVSVTGEALKKEIAQRWFAAQPGIKLVNAYGLTETSDDTNHEIMERAPDSERVPLGRPIQNAYITVVDEHLLPVPLGAPGEIVFSGVCVGRGYINDPERTRQAFMADPHRPGYRLYRSGDFGRWRPDGKLEYFGRRDAQVKISGFRIEIGEVENALLRLDGVRDGAVVVTEQGERSKRLVAFYTSPRPLDAHVLQARLGASLPGCMVPSVFHWRERLPLTGNGKTDRKALTALARELDVAEPDAAEDGDALLQTATEDRLADAWARVIGIPRGRIGRRDHFFNLGGTSLAAVKLAIALNRAVSIRGITGHPILADLAALIDGRRSGS
jgi:amino acid adenylation domain-containing protein